MALHVSRWDRAQMAGLVSCLFRSLLTSLTSIIEVIKHQDRDLDPDPNHTILGLYPCDVVRPCRDRFLLTGGSGGRRHMSAREQISTQHWSSFHPVNVHLIGFCHSSFHCYLEIVTASSCFGSMVAEALPLCCKASSDLNADVVTASLMMLKLK